MECPQCGLAVLVEHGKITQHLRPTDMQACAGGDDRPTPAAADHRPAAAKPPTKKAPAKKAP